MVLDDSKTKNPKNIKPWDLININFLITEILNQIKNSIFSLGDRYFLGEFL